MLLATHIEIRYSLRAFYCCEFVGGKNYLFFNIRAVRITHSRYSRISLEMGRHYLPWGNEWRSVVLVRTSNISELHPHGTYSQEGCGSVIQTCFLYCYLSRAHVQTDPVGCTCCTGYTKKVYSRKLEIKGNGWTNFILSRGIDL